MDWETLKRNSGEAFEVRGVTREGEIVTVAPLPCRYLCCDGIFQNLTSTPLQKRTSKPSGRPNRTGKESAKRISKARIYRGVVIIVAFLTVNYITEKQRRPYGPKQIIEEQGLRPNPGPPRRRLWSKVEPGD